MKLNKEKNLRLKIVLECINIIPQLSNSSGFLDERGVVKRAFKMADEIIKEHKR